LLNPGNTISAILANQFLEVLDPFHIGALIYLALILFTFTLAVNVLAVFLVQVLGFKQRIVFQKLNPLPISIYENVGYVPIHLGQPWVTTDP
jgi:hypothetical protein